MSSHRHIRHWRTAAALGILAAAAAAWLAWGPDSTVEGQATPTLTLAAATGESDVFSPAHSSLGEAIRHFFGIRPEPEQPIPFTHTLHINEVGLQCRNCHVGVEQGPNATLPSVTICMGCHAFVATDRPPIQMLTSYYDQGIEPPWERVYGWYPDAHVRFNHAPHIRAEVECSTCHGDIPSMTVAERAVDHTMGFCIACHEENNASNECMTCHY